MDPIEEDEDPTALERAAVGLVLGIAGFATGVFCWWIFTGVPGFDFPWRYYFYFSCVLGLVCFLLGLWRPKGTVDALGSIWDKLTNLSNEVLDWFRFLR
jgi:MFS family permease